MKKQTFSILFYSRKNRATKKGQVPIRMRITLNGVCTELSIKRKIDAKQWSQKQEKATGKDIVCIELNKYLESLKGRIYKILRDFENRDELYDINSIKRHLQGENKETPKMFFEIFQEHNNRYQKLVGIDITKTTYERYVRTLAYFKEWFCPLHEKEDIPVSELNLDIIEGFEVFVKTEKGCAQNAANKHLKNIKKQTNFALNNGWISRNPFEGKVLAEKEVDVAFLLRAEVDTIRNKKIEIKRLAFLVENLMK